MKQADILIKSPRIQTCLLRKYLVYDLGGQVPSQTVFGSIGSDTIHGHIQVIYQLMQNQLNPSDILMGASNGYFLRIQWKGYGDITTNKL